jgi:hypothetical protein
MKTLILAALTFSLLAPPLAIAAETKKVCVDQTDPKTKQTKEVCKTITVHKKLEGTKVPDKKDK